jgi:hypothetical protein
MSTEVNLTEFIILVVTMIMLVAVIAAPTASLAAAYQPHAHRSGGHHDRIAAPAYYPQDCGGGSC